MALSIATNSASLHAQRVLERNTSGLARTFERLSSGQRVNRASDDAAGLSIETRMDAIVRGSDRARANAADGVSVAQTADGALGEISAILGRVRELAVQSANDSNNASDRRALADEANQLLSSIDAVATGAQFNGRSLLDGTTSRMVFHVGSGSEASAGVAVDLAGATSAQLGALAKQTNAMTSASNGAAIAGNGDVVINGVNIASSAQFGSEVRHSGTNTQNGSAYAKARAINASSAGVEASAGETTRTAAFGAVAAAYTLTVNDVQIFTSAVIADSNDLAARINQRSGETGVTAEVNGASYTLRAADGRNINATSSADANGFLAAGDTTMGSLTVSSEAAITVSAGGTAVGFGAATGSVSLDSHSLRSKVDLTTRAGALEAIDRVDSASEKVLGLRSKMGAIQNRLEASASNLASVSENVSAARARIKDADFASETAKLTRQQILQQAGTTILAQANVMPQQALQLLR